MKQLGPYKIIVIIAAIIQSIIVVVAGYLLFKHRGFTSSQSSLPPKATIEQQKNQK
jgi:hypothetical protein